MANYMAFLEPCFSYLDNGDIVCHRPVIKTSLARVGRVTVVSLMTKGAQAPVSTLQQAHMTC